MTTDSKHRPLVPTPILLLVILPAIMTLLAWSIEVQIYKPIWAHTLTIVLVAAFWFSLGKRWLNKHGLGYSPAVGRWVVNYLFLGLPAAYGFVCLYDFALAEPFHLIRQLIALALPTWILILYLYE